MVEHTFISVNGRTLCYVAICTHLVLLIAASLHSWTSWAAAVLSIPTQDYFLPLSSQIIPISLSLSLSLSLSQRCKETLAQCTSELEEVLEIPLPIDILSSTQDHEGEGESELFISHHRRLFLALSSPSRK